MALSLLFPKKHNFWEIIKMGNVLNLGNVQAILRSSDSLFAKKLLLSEPNDLVSAAKITTATVATASALARTNLSAFNISVCSQVAFQNELEKQSKQQAYEDKLNSIRQSVNSTNLKASQDATTASSAFYYASGKGLNQSHGTVRSEILKDKKGVVLKNSLESENNLDGLKPVIQDSSFYNDDSSDPSVIEQELKEIFLNSSVCASKSIFENELSLDDTPIFFGSEYSHSVSASVAKLVDNMVDTLLSYQRVPLNNAMGMICTVSELMKVARDNSTTAIESISQASIVTTNQYNPKVIMLPLYVLGYSIIDYIKRYNCKEFNYKKERKKAEEKIAHNEKESKQRMAEFAASFQFNYS